MSNVKSVFGRPPTWPKLSTTQQSSLSAITTTTVILLVTSSILACHCFWCCTAATVTAAALRNTTTNTTTSAVTTATTTTTTATNNTDFDVIVYDATSGGVMAAVAAARQGAGLLRVLLICASWPACFSEGGERVGGMSSGGLGQSDIGGKPEVIIGGLAREFYLRNRLHYRGGGNGPPPSNGSSTSSCRCPSPECQVTYNLEPHVALGIFESMLAEANVTVWYGAQVEHVQTISVSAVASASFDTSVTTTGNIYGRDGSRSSVDGGGGGGDGGGGGGSVGGSKEGNSGIGVENAAATPRVITALTLDDGRTATLSPTGVVIEAGYEGDLMARAGVSYIIGRESSTTYNESLNGDTGGMRGNQFTTIVDPFDDQGNPLPFVSSGAPRAPGGADKKVQAYNFRLCLTQNTSNKAAFPRPANYKTSDWELVRRAYGSKGGRHGVPSCNNAPVPGGKTDMNNCGDVSSDLIGGSWDYPEANYSMRRQIWAQHRDYVQGLLWTLAHDPAVDAKTRATLATWGLCADEFPATAHFPPALYVRAARRLVGDRVFTQNTPKTQGPLGSHSVGLGSYNFDSHNAERLACKGMAACFGRGPHGANNTTSYAWNEGDVQISPGEYEIPYWVMLPKRSELDNLLVVAAPSASHIGMSTLRMEPQFMILGHAAGTAAALAIRNASSPPPPSPSSPSSSTLLTSSPPSIPPIHANVHTIDLGILQSRLVAAGQIVHVSSPPPQPVACLGKLGGDVRRCMSGGVPPSGASSKCDASCKAMAIHEWIALRQHWKVTPAVGGKPARAVAAHATFLKKSELKASSLPSNETITVPAGQVWTSGNLSTVVDFDDSYWLFTLLGSS